MINIPVAFGELVDKVSILKIKSERIKDEEKLKNIDKEFSKLFILMNEKLGINLENDFFIRLVEINKKLWDIEDKIRLKERDSLFDLEFIELARSVYKCNDLRAKIKKEVDIYFKSELTEEKSYEKY